VELWEDGRCWEEVSLSHGLCSFNFGPRGLVLNGRRLTIRGVARDPSSEADALPLRKAGCNLLLASTTAGQLWELADRLGFLMMGRVEERWLNKLVIPAAIGSRYPQLLKDHASSLAWLLPEQVLTRDPAWWQTAVATRPPGRSPLLGVELTHAPPRPLPRGVQFVVCDEKVLPRLAQVQQPKVILTDSPKSLDEEAAIITASPDVVGWIAR
jgi:hypothetical protein